MLNVSIVKSRTNSTGSSIDGMVLLSLDVLVLTLFIVTLVFRLPFQCQEEASVHLDSLHPSGAAVLEKTVFLQGASSLEVGVGLVWCCGRC